jgi:hypothetical protein
LVGAGLGTELGSYVVYFTKTLQKRSKVEIIKEKAEVSGGQEAALNWRRMRGDTWGPATGSRANFASARPRVG